MRQQEKRSQANEDKEIRKLKKAMKKKEKLEKKLRRKEKKEKRSKLLDDDSDFSEAEMLVRTNLKSLQIYTLAVFSSIKAIKSRPHWTF